MPTDRHGLLVVVADVRSSRRGGEGFLGKLGRSTALSRVKQQRSKMFYVNSTVSTKRVVERGSYRGTCFLL